MTLRPPFLHHPFIWNNATWSQGQSARKMLLATTLQIKVTHLCTYQYTGHRWGLVGINCDLHVNFDPRGGAFDLSPHNLCHEVRMAAKKVLVSWRSLHGCRKRGARGAQPPPPPPPPQFFGLGGGGTGGTKKWYQHLQVSNKY